MNERPRRFGRWAGKTDGIAPHPLHSLNEHGADITAEQVEFGRACEKAKRRLGVVSLSPSQILAVAESLGYRRFQSEE